MYAGVGHALGREVAAEATSRTLYADTKSMTSVADVKVRPTTVLGCDLFVLLNRLAIPTPINRRRHTPQCLAVRFCGRRRRKPGAVAARCPPFDRAALTAVWRQPDPVGLKPVDAALASRDARPVPIVISNSSSGTAAVDRLHF